jgi:hypothetical protein
VRISSLFVPLTAATCRGTISKILIVTQWYASLRWGHGLEGLGFVSAAGSGHPSGMSGQPERPTSAPLDRLARPKHKRPRKAEKNRKEVQPPA